MRPSTDLTTDTSLLRRVGRGGHAAAWTELHDRYAGLVRAYARRRGVPAGECDDVVQEVFLRLLRCMPRFAYDRSRGRFRGLLCTLTLRSISERCAARPRSPAADPAMLDVAATGSAEHDEAWETEWRAWHVERAMQRIRREFARLDVEAFRLYGVEGRPVAAVAESLGMSVHQVYKAKSRIMLRLAELVTLQLGEEP